MRPKHTADSAVPYAVDPIIDVGLQTALVGRVDNAQIHDHVWQPCVSHKPPMDKRCGKTLVPALSPARRVGSPSALSIKSVIDE